MSSHASSRSLDVLKNFARLFKTRKKKKPNQMTDFTVISGLQFRLNSDFFEYESIFTMGAAVCSASKKIQVNTIAMVYNTAKIIGAWWTGSETIQLKMCPQKIYHTDAGYNRTCPHSAEGLGRRDGAAPGHVSRPVCRWPPGPGPGRARAVL
jgi:hypothetical protein